MSKFNVIGLGSAGTKIADNFNQYSQYKVYKIGTDIKKDKYSYVLPVYQNLEEYEKNAPKLRTFFRLVKNDVLFIIGGSGISSVASLSILQQIKHCNIFILYVKPDVELLNLRQEKIHKMVYNVLQEYARSGMFEQFYIVDNSIIETALGNLSIEEYYKHINNMISSTLHMIHVFKNIPFVIGNLTFSSEISKLATYGIVDINTGKESLFFPLDEPFEKEYYYAINEKSLKEDGSLYNKIKEQIKEKRVNKVKVSYGIYSTDYDDNYAFVVAKSPQIQK